MKLLRFLLAKYFFPRGVNLLSFAVLLSVVGVAVGVLQLMVVLAVLSGFQDLFRENYTRISSELVVMPHNLSRGENRAAEVLGEMKEITAFTPSLLAPAMVIKGGKVGGVIFEGVDYESSKKVTPWHDIWVKEPEPESSPAEGEWVWLGVQLAKKLRADVGDTVDVLVPEGKQQRVVSMKVTGITKFGIYDHDLHHARMGLPALGKIFRRSNQATMYKSKIRPGENFEKVAQRVRDSLGKEYTVKLWKDLHQNIFMAVEHQKQSLFLVLEILIGLAAVNVVNLLLMSAHFRKRDLAILRAMGMKFREVMAFFLVQGSVVGAVGVVLGLISGFAVCWFIERFQPSLLNESIYNAARLPLRIETTDLVLVAAGGVGLCLLFSVIPAWSAARAKPVEALRLENA